MEKNLKFDLLSEISNNLVKYIFASIIIFKIIGFLIKMIEKQYIQDKTYKIPENYNINDIEIFNDDNYNSIIAGSNITYKYSDNQFKKIKAFGGKKVILLIDRYEEKNPVFLPLEIYSITSKDKDIYYYAMALVVNILDKLIDKYEDITGSIPSPNQYKNRPIRIEVAYINAGGLAGHGFSGMAAGPEFLRQFYNSCVKFLQDNNNLPRINHVYTYELMRNYIIPWKFTDILDYRLEGYSKEGTIFVSNYDKKLDYGWVNQGFVNVAGALISTSIEPKIGFSYHGKNLDEFCNGMEYNLDQYLNGNYKWEDVFTYQRLPWDEYSTLDNIYSGLLIRLWKNYGKNDFLKRFWSLLNNDGLRRRTPYNYFFVYNNINKEDYLDKYSFEEYQSDRKLNMQTAVENFYIICSYAAKNNMYDYFKNTLRFTPRDEAKEFANQLLTS